MKRLPFPLLIFILMILAASAGFFMHKALNAHRTPMQRPSSMTDMLLIGLPRPEFKMKDMDGRLRKISEWDGKIIVLNFWASWCPPCRNELPGFIELQKKYADQGLQFIGIAVDIPENVRQFMQQIPLNFPTLVDEVEAMKIAGIYGNTLGALPYTVIIDRSGKIVFTHTGELKQSQAEKLISSLLKKS